MYEEHGLQVPTIIIRSVHHNFRGLLKNLVKEQRRESYDMIRVIF